MLLSLFKSILFKQGKIFPVEDTHTQHTHTHATIWNQKGNANSIPEPPPQTYNVYLKNIKYRDHVISLTINITTKSFTDCVYIWPEKTTFFKKKLIMSEIHTRKD